MNIPFFGSNGPDDTGEEDDPAAGPTTVAVDEDLAEEIHSRAAKSSPVVSIIPFKEDDGGFPKSRAFFRNIFSMKRRGKNRRKNHSSPFAFEMVYWRNRRTITFRYASSDPDMRRTLRQGAESHYSDADIQEAPEPLLDVEEGDHVSAARLRLRNETGLNYLRPINHYKLNKEDFEIHPYDGITSAMMGDSYGVDASVVVQVVMRPAISSVDEESNKDLEWHQDAGTLAEEIKSSDTDSIRWSALFEIIGDAFTKGQNDIQMLEEDYVSAEDKAAADAVANQKGELGYDVNIRLVACSEQPAIAEQRIRDVGEKYHNFYNSRHGQGLRAIGANEEATRRLVERTSDRAWVDRQMPMSIDVLAALAGPAPNLSTGGVEYTYTRSDDGLAPGIKTFEHYDETGITEELTEFRRERAGLGSEADTDEGGSLTDQLGAAMEAATDDGSED